jgi:hypothetical protein
MGGEHCQSQSLLQFPRCSGVFNSFKVLEKADDEVAGFNDSVLLCETSD